MSKQRSYLATDWNLVSGPNSPYFFIVGNWEEITGRFLGPILLASNQEKTQEDTPMNRRLIATATLCLSLGAGVAVAGNAGALCPTDGPADGRERAGDEPAAAYEAGLWAWEEAGEEGTEAQPEGGQGREEDERASRRTRRRSSPSSEMGFCCLRQASLSGWPDLFAEAWIAVWIAGWIRRSVEFPFALT
jgi:hypothetical protein